MASRLAPRYTLHVRPFAGGSRDAHGNTVATFGPLREWRVFGFASGANTSPYDPNREHLSHVLWTVYAPVAGLPADRDRVVLGGVEYDIDGQPRDYSHDPFGHEVGQGVVYLKAVNG